MLGANWVSKWPESHEEFMFLKETLQKSSWNWSLCDYCMSDVLRGFERWCWGNLEYSLIPLMLEQSWGLWAPFLGLDLRIEATKVQLSVPYFHIRGGASSKAREPSQCPQDPSGSSRFTISVTFLLCPPPTINSTTKIIKKICDNWEGGHIIFYCIPHN